MKEKPFYEILKYAHRAEVKANFVESAGEESAVGSYRSVQAAEKAIRATDKPYRIYDVMKQKYIA